VGGGGCDDRTIQKKLHWKRGGGRLKTKGKGKTKQGGKKKTAATLYQGVNLKKKGRQASQPKRKNNQLTKKKKTEEDKSMVGKTGGQGGEHDPHV